jgi:hypothetical protein
MVLFARAEACIWQQPDQAPARTTHEIIAIIRNHCTI